MNQPFRYYMQVRYGECDAQKVVFNARYADYIDLAATEFLRSIHDPEQLPDGGFDYQVVKLIIEWKASARSRDQLEIAVKCTQMGNTSFTLTMDMTNARTGQFLASGEMISVAVHPTTFEKISLPDLMRKAMAKGGQGQYVDHAGFTQPDLIAQPWINSPSG